MEKFDHVNNNFIHRWLHFDPLDQGFLKEDKMCNDHKKFRNVLVWLLNIAVMYSDCKFKNNLRDLDFAMNCFLKYRRKEKWLNQFEFTAESMESLWEISTWHWKLWRYYTSILSFCCTMVYIGTGWTIWVSIRNWYKEGVASTNSYWCWKNEQKWFSFWKSSTQFKHIGFNAIWWS